MIGLRMPDEVHAALVKMADERKQSRNTVILEAFRAWVEKPTLVKAPRSKRGQKMFLVRVPDRLHEALAQASGEHGRSLNAEALQALLSWLGGN